MEADKTGKIITTFDEWKKEKRLEIRYLKSNIKSAKEHEKKEIIRLKTELLNQIAAIKEDTKKTIAIANRKIEKYKNPTIEEYNEEAEHLRKFVLQYNKDNKIIIVGDYK